MGEKEAAPTPANQRPIVAMLLFNNSTIGGAERRYAWVYQELRRRHVPIVLAINESLLVKLQRIGVLPQHEAPEFLLKEPMGKRLFALRKLDYLLGLCSLSKWIRRRRPHVLHVVLGGAYLALPLQLIGAAPPAVLSVVCPSLSELVGSSAGLLFYRLALRLASRVDTLTDSVRRMVAHEGVPPSRIQVSPGSCVDTSRFHPAEKQPWVVFSGRLIPEKDPLTYVRACALACERLNGRLPGLRIFLLGDGPLLGEVKTLIGQLRLEPWIQTGWTEHVESILSQAMVFVSLQRTDNYPSQALLEAMASGAAIIATDVGLTSTLVDATVGRLVQADPPQVAQAIVEMLEDPVGTSAKGQQARERVVRDHSLDRYLAYIQHLYRQTAST